MRNLKERLKKLRKSLDMTQQAFADKIGMKQNTIAQYEMGRTVPSDAIIFSICREFNVNEHWLRDGTGNMFIERDIEDQLMEWAGKVLGDQDSKFKKRFVTMLMGLTEDEWEFLERKAKELVGENEKD